MGLLTRALALVFDQQTLGLQSLELAIKASQGYLVKDRPIQAAVANIN